MREIALWAAFAVSYELVRWAAAGKRETAVANAEAVIRAERHLHLFVEHDLQRAFIEGPRLVLHLADWTYWLAQFVVVVAAFVWAYFRRYRLYARFRNAFFLANTLGLITYITVPLAPPRLFPEEGLVDTLRRYEGLNMHSGIVRGLANQYAAMPSLHAADALIVGVMLCAAARQAAAARRLARLAGLGIPGARRDREPLRARHRGRTRAGGGGYPRRRSALRTYARRSSSLPQTMNGNGSRNASSTAPSAVVANIVWSTGR